ncbi:MAG: hypothetical protein PHC83_03340 [Bacteroidales bacterium]|nr:hypothetical protein [Bacteroidales bacterium]
MKINTRLIRALIILCLILFYGCKNNSDSNNGLIAKNNFYKLIDETIDNSHYLLFFDSLSNKLIFFENKDVYRLKKPKNFLINNETKNMLLDTLNYHPIKIALYDDKKNEFFECKNRIVIQKNYLFFCLLDPKNYFGGYCYYILFKKNNKIINYKILPNNKSTEDYHYFSFAYLDIYKDYLITENCLYISSITRLISLYKIDSNDVVKINEIEKEIDLNYFHFLKKNEENYKYYLECRLMKNIADQIKR